MHFQWEKTQYVATALCLHCACFHVVWVSYATPAGLRSSRHTCYANVGTTRRANKNKTMDCAHVCERGEAGVAAIDVCSYDVLICI